VAWRRVPSFFLHTSYSFVVLLDLLANSLFIDYLVKISEDQDFITLLEAQSQLQVFLYPLLIPAYHLSANPPYIKSLPSSTSEFTVTSDFTSLSKDRHQHVSIKISHRDVLQTGNL
jgi:hypothetical protein